MEGLELTAFQIISAVGFARSSYIEAIHKAKAGDFAGAEALMEKGNEMFAEGHHAHAGLLQQEAEEGSGSVLSLLIIHAEDQLMSAEGFKTIALGKALSMNVLVEGIETEKQEQQLLHMGCDSGQGFFYAPPMTATEFYEEFLPKHS